MTGVVTVEKGPYVPSVGHLIERVYGNCRTRDIPRWFLYVNKFYIFYLLFLFGKKKRSVYF